MRRTAKPVARAGKKLTAFWRRLVSRNRKDGGNARGRFRLRRPTAREFVISLIVLAVAAATAGGLTRLRVETAMDSFLPQGDPTVSAIEQNARSFGGDPIVVLLESSKPRQLLTDEDQFGKLLRLEGTLSQLPDVATVYGPATVMNQIAISSQDMLAQISGARDALQAQAEQKARSQHLSAAKIQAAGKAAVAKFDARYGALLVKGLPGGLPTTSNPSFINNVIYDQSGQPRVRWKFVVPNANSVTELIRPREDLDGAGTERLVSAVRAAVQHSGLKTSRVTVTGVPAITSSLTHEVLSEMPVLGGLAVLVILLRFLIAPSLTTRLRRLWPLLAAVIGSALTLSAFGWLDVPMSFGAIALFPLLLGIGSSFPLYLASFADRRRVLVVSLASAAAFGSLAISPLPFVRELGIALGVGVLLTVAATLALGDVVAPIPASAPGRPRSTARRSLPAGQRWLVLGALVAVAGLGWGVLPRLDIQANPENLAKGLPELTRAQYAEHVLGSSGDVSIVLRGTDTQSPQALHWLQQAENVVVGSYGDRIQPILTAPDLLSFLGNSPTPAQISAGVGLLPPYLVDAVFTPDCTQAVMDFGLKFQDLGAQTKLLDEVQAALPKPPSGYKVQIVGLPVAADRAYTLITNDRYLSNAAGIVVAGAILLLGLRRRRDGLRAVLAAVLATGWTLTALWVLGQSLNPLTVALGSLITVTGCEFTVLLIDARQEEGSRLRRVVVWACATSVLGYLSLVPSRIALLREFGIALTATVLFSYLAATAVVRLIPVKVPTETGKRPVSKVESVELAEPVDAEVMQ
ncbi:MMPL family transporter [Actinacidiphila oryziradicis]|uniref:RND transporter n=1 Tax=Actinacidiphila oryziradicis TaxID=2571141 RepID=A0A4U0S770_9ACTN|nr:MMPL family transporter [Actinacidiphila oryziradicis]TKA04986.1 RND transporter [Actinacidiphila oryziradicis]